MYLYNYLNWCMYNIIKLYTYGLSTIMSNRITVIKKKKKTILCTYSTLIDNVLIIECL